MSPLTETVLVFVLAVVISSVVAYGLIYGRKPPDQKPPQLPAQGPPPLPFQNAPQTFEPPAPMTVQAPPPIVPGADMPAWPPPVSAGSRQETGSPSASYLGVHDEKSARKNAYQGMGAAFIVAAVTLAFSFLARAGGFVMNGIGSNAWLDAVVFAALGVGILCMSRVAAIGALLLYIVERIAMAHASGMNPLSTVAFVFCFAQGVRGTLAFQWLRRQSTQSPQAAPARPLTGAAGPIPQ